jgi:hypothetical protein
MARIELFEHSGFGGRQVVLTDDESNLDAIHNFNDETSSCRVTSGTFTLFQHINYEGFSFTVCARGGPGSDGEYPNPSTLADRNGVVSSVKKNSDEPQ